MNANRRKTYYKDIDTEETHYRIPKVKYNAMVSLLLLLEERCSELERKDYSMRESELKKLHALLESEKDMNNQLTKENIKLEQQLGVIDET